MFNVRVLVSLFINSYDDKVKTAFKSVGLHAIKNEKGECKTDGYNLSPYITLFYLTGIKI